MKRRATENKVILSENKVILSENKVILSAAKNLAGGAPPWVNRDPSLRHDTPTIEGKTVLV